MSIKLMTKVWENGPEDRTETIVLLALADRANDDGSSCFPSIAEVSQRARLSRRGTQKVITRLEEAGYLTVDKCGGPGGVNNYQLHPSKLEGRTQDTGGEHDSPGGEPDDAKGRTSFARNHQEPSNNRQESAPARGGSDDVPDRLNKLRDIATGNWTRQQIKEAARDKTGDPDSWRKLIYQLAHPDYTPHLLTLSEWEEIITDPVTWAKAVKKGIDRGWQPNSVDAREDTYHDIREQNGHETPNHDPTTQSGVPGRKVA